MGPYKSQSLIVLPVALRLTRHELCPGIGLTIGIFLNASKENTGAESDGAGTAAGSCEHLRAPGQYRSPREAAIAF